MPVFPGEENSMLEKLALLERTAQKSPSLLLLDKPPTLSPSRRHSTAAQTTLPPRAVEIHNPHPHSFPLAPPSLFRSTSDGARTSYTHLDHPYVPYTADGDEEEGRWWSWRGVTAEDRRGQQQQRQSHPRELKMSPPKVQPSLQSAQEQFDVWATLSPRHPRTSSNLLPYSAVELNPPSSRERLEDEIQRSRPHVSASDPRPPLAQASNLGVGGEADGDGDIVGNGKEKSEGKKDKKGKGKGFLARVRESLSKRLSSSLSSSSSSVGVSRSRSGSGASTSSTSAASASSIGATGTGVGVGEPGSGVRVDSGGSRRWRK